MVNPKLAMGAIMPTPNPHCQPSRQPASSAGRYIGIHAAPADAPLPPQDAEVLHHVLPSRQGLAADLLRGSVPGSMERLAPDAVVSDVEGWVESDATVERLAHWHRESPDG